METKKFNFVYEKITEEDRKFIESFHINRVYHGGMVDVVYWVYDKEKGMYFVDNDAPLGLVLEGVDGPQVANFIYKNIVNTIKYDYYEEGWGRVCYWSNEKSIRNIFGQSFWKSKNWDCKLIKKIWAWKM